MTDRELLKLIGKKIQKARFAADMTQECLAELVGIHWKTVGRIERGEFHFAVTHFVRLMQHLDLPIDALLEGLPAPDLKRSSAIRKAMGRKRAAKVTKGH